MDTTNISWLPSNTEIVLSEEVIKSKTIELGKQITLDYVDSLESDKPLLLICLLKGSVIFMSDLMRHINLPVEIDFLTASSYGDATSSSGKVIVDKPLTTDIENKDILIIEDIVDSGLTLKEIVHYLRTNNPRSIKICSLISKLERREIEVNLDYVGFELDRGFVIGYGLDYAQLYRNLPFIAELKT